MDGDLNANVPGTDALPPESDELDRGEPYVMVLADGNEEIVGNAWLMMTVVVV